MANVSDLISLLDAKLLGYIDALDTTGHTGQTKKIEALNAGKEKVWQIMVSGNNVSQDNWFATTAAFSFGIGVVTDAMPSDFHILLSAESSSAKMEQSNWHKESWRKGRSSGNQALDTNAVFYYLISGNNLLIGPPPATTLAGTVHYIQRLTEWTAVGDSADVVPSTYHDAICNYAASMLIAGTKDYVGAEYWWKAWQDDKELIKGSSSMRNQGADLNAEDIDMQT